MSAEAYEAVLQEVMRAFHCDHEKAEAFARYCAETETAALRETAIERGDYE